MTTDPVTTVPPAARFATGYHERVLALVQAPGVLVHSPEPLTLASGELSNHFIDGKLAVEHPDALQVVGAAMAAAAAGCGATFDAVGGLVLGCVPFTFALAGAARCRWFLIRKEPKGRGTNRWSEGARLEPGMRVALVDDVITTGGSIADAHRRVTESGAVVTFATTLVDRGERATAYFAGEGVAYVPMLTYGDLGIPPVGGGAG